MQFFPPLAEFEPPYPVAPDGILPNSVVLGQLRKSKADQDLAAGWKPPILSLKQKNLMEEMEEVHPLYRKSVLLFRVSLISLLSGARG